MRSWLAVALLLVAAVPARADLAILMPQAPSDAGFVSNSGGVSLDEIATGGVWFVLLEPEARGWARFDLSPIPPGSVVDAVHLIAWVCNHDLATSGTACAKTVQVVDAGVDPQTAGGAALFAAIGTGTVYATSVANRTGPAFCLEYYQRQDYDLGSGGAADVQAALGAGWFTVGLRSDTPCDPTSDHLDWIGYSESISGADPGCTLSTLPGSRLQLIVSYTPPVVPCNAGAITPVQLVRAVKSTNRQSVDMSWQSDAAAEGYDVWSVDVKTLIPQARSGGAGAAVSGCQATAGTSCRDAGAVPPAPAGPRLYYQVRGECGGTEAAE